MERPFRSDGCGVVPDYDQQECCVRHDWLYWRGGSFRDRARADREFYECVRTTKSGWLAPFRWFGVRIGGVGFLPFRKWRWGYGWDWPRTRAAADDKSPYTVENQQQAFKEAWRRPRTEIGACGESLLRRPTPDPPAVSC